MSVSGKRDFSKGMWHLLGPSNNPWLKLLLGVPRCPKTLTNTSVKEHPPPRSDHTLAGSKVVRSFTAFFTILKRDFFFKFQDYQARKRIQENTQTIFQAESVTSMGEFET